MDKKKARFAERVYALVAEVPAGRVATYGQIATLLGHPRSARAVGTALAGLRFGAEADVPWHRIINATGGISAPNDAHRHAIQRALLEAEGVVFGAGARCDLGVYGWAPGASRYAPEDEPQHVGLSRSTC